jgi:hypothetical protein
VSVSSTSSNNYLFFNFKTGAATSVQPVYNAVASKRRVVLNSWNYVSVSIREYKDINIMKYEMQMAISNTNMGTVNNAGYDNT